MQQESWAGVWISANHTTIIPDDSPLDEWSLDEWSLDGLSLILTLSWVPKTPFITAFGERIRAFRQERGLTQEALADLAGMHFSAIGHIERASRSSTLETVEKLAVALQVHPRDLIPDTQLKVKKRR